MCVRWKQTAQLLTIGAGLSQPKELKDLLESLITMVVRVLKDCGVQLNQLNDLFSTLIESVAVICYFLGCCCIESTDF